MGAVGTGTGTAVPCPYGVKGGGGRQEYLAGDDSGASPSPGEDAAPLPQGRGVGWDIARLGHARAKGLSDFAEEGEGGGGGDTNGEEGAGGEGAAGLFI